MHRLAPVLLIGAVLLLATSLGAPASPTRAPAAGAPPAFLDEQASAVLNEVNAQVEHLRSRLANPPAPPDPDRDPFRFGDRRDPAPEAPGDPLFENPIAPPPPRVLPRLVAIVVDDVDGAQPRAFVAFGGTVREVAAGDILGPFTVRAIGGEAVELFDSERSATHYIGIH